MSSSPNSKFSSFLLQFLSILLLLNELDGAPRLEGFIGSGLANEEKKINSDQPLRRWSSAMNENKENLDAERQQKETAAEKLHPADQGEQAALPAGDALTELLESLSRSSLIRSLMEMVAKVDSNGRLNGARTFIERDVEKKAEAANGLRIERRSAASTERTKVGADRLQNGTRIMISQRRQFDHPPSPSPRSPTIRSLQIRQQQPEFSGSLDPKPMTIEKKELSFPPPSKGAELDQQMASIHDAINKEWKHALFGRSGLLTEVFNFINDKRKEGLQKQAQQSPQGEKPPNEFAKILEQLLHKAQTGDFDEPLPEIPFIGICDRLSCADIYKALDEFRKSEFFSNFQTAVSLLNDPKGFDMIGELLANPELLENFTGPENLGELFGTGGAAKSVVGKNTRGDLPQIGENTDAENIGVDFSSYGEKHGEKSGSAPSPQIATSIDAVAPDYYSNVDEKVQLVKTIAKEDKLLPIPEEKGSIDERPLPPIAESIDARPTFDEEDEFPEGPMTFEKNEFLPGAVSINGTKKILITPSVDILLGRNKQQKLTEAGNHNRSNAREHVHVQGGRRVTDSSDKGTRKSNLNWKTPTPTGTIAISTTTPATIRRNFRRDDDYYAMYYDSHI